MVDKVDPKAGERSRAGHEAEAAIGERRLSPVAGPLLLWGLGVGYVISGDYYGWNFGLAATGYWGFLIALGIVAVLYATMCAAIAEMSAAIPHAGGPYAFARMALGPVGGYLCGVGVIIEYVVAPAGVATAIGAYVNVLVPVLPTVVTAIAVYAIFTAVHLYGVGSSLILELIFTAVATLMLVVFFVVGLPSITFANLNEVGGGAVFPEGIGGLWAALPLAAWFFLAIEGLPMAAEEARNPERDMPRALVSSFVTLAVLAFLTLTVAAGLGGAREVGEAAAPLPVAVQNGLGDGHWLVGVISFVGLAGLLASFHGIVLAYSRQIFALARTGYLPSALSRVNDRRAPTWALVVPGLVGVMLVILGSTLGAGAIPVLVTMAVFGAAISYILMIVSAIVLRRRRPDLPRPYRMPGGEATAWVALVLALVLLPAGIKDYPVAMLFGLLVFAAFAAYYFLYGRHRLVSRSIEEELSIIEGAESELR
jgi:ethanolamine permease